MAKKNDTTEDLLNQLGEDKPVEVADLLDSIDESGATPWKPQNAGEGVQGKVTGTSTVSSEYTSEPIPVVEVVDGNGEAWSIRGYASVLRNEINKANPQPGDTFAVKYFGKKETKNGQGSYHHYMVAIRKAATPAASNGTPF